MYTIYALIDPRDNTIHYIGITHDVYQRFIEHINCSSSNFAKNAWVIELRAANQMIVMKTLEQVEHRTEAEDRESYWIKHFEKLQAPLKNVSKMTAQRRMRNANVQIRRRLNVGTANASHSSKVATNITQDIRRLASEGYPKRKAALIVGLSGRKYKLFQQIYLDESIVFSSWSA